MEFVGLDGIDLLVLDNHSRESGTKKYLESLPSQIDVHRFSDRIPHELHRAMNYAIKYSREKDNKYVNFIQDDYQYLYCLPDMLKWVHETFEGCPDVIQLQTNMGWKRKEKKIGKVQVVTINGVKWFKLLKKPACDNGFTRVSIYDTIGLYPTKTSIHGREKGYVSGESWFSKKTKSRYRRMMLAHPNMGMIMDCAYVRGKRRMGRYFPPPNKYYIKPLDKVDLTLIEELASKNKFSFIEEILEADGWIPDSIHQKHNTRDIRTKL